jgi:hypothetical protein
MLVAFYTVFLVALAWMLPWLPFGLSESNYSGTLIALMIIVMSLAFFALVALTLRYRSRQMQESIRHVATVRDRVKELRRREFFFDRLVIECERARQSRLPFGVIVIRIGGGTMSRAEIGRLHAAVEALGGNGNEDDWVAVIGVNEIGMLVQQANPEMVASIAERARWLAASPAPQEEHAVLAGWSIYGHDGFEAGDLISRARRRFSPTLAA